MNYLNTKHIAAGHLQTGKEETDKLQAYLGTCVGLALYDESTKIGGMIHILLPEPLSTGSVDFPEKYASTGVPILINKLIDLGALPENLKASIAGGALVGPVSRQDINLDIGGRSAEITVSILKNYKITTIKSETGGFFACTLELDMESGKTNINPAFEDNTKSQGKASMPSQKDILKTIDQLKPIPQTALKILRMFQLDQHNITQITKELSHDQVLTGKTLKLCNSAFFAGSIKIESLKDAVLLLGQSMLIKSVITTVVNDYFAQTGTSGYSLCKGGLFFHAVGVATLCEKITEKSKQTTIESAYTAGLLHDVGKVVLDQYIADLLMEKFYTGFDLETMQTKNFENALDHLGVTMADLPELIDAIPINGINDTDIKN
ncbi:MAG: HDOD domain-containing protein [Deltaproteobacteria bacterium]|jgi:chemotaxis receptor (MCP) glutamine deamidase CheD|nr:HDOD domain-containing protein [Deltaproteobacteria bacterium]